MKKSLLALAVFGAFAGAASAQTAVTVYGIVDMGIVAERGGATGSVTKLTSGVGSGSRLGFRGTEDLGGGMSALFVLETGIAVDGGGLSNNGASTAAGSGGSGIGFGRQSFAGLKGGFGTVTLGRQYTPQFLVLTGVADPFGTGFAGNSGNLMQTTGVRMSNTIKYVTPNFGGFGAEVAYGFGEVAGANSAARQIGAAVGYANGPIEVRLGYHDRNYNPAAAGDERSALLAGTYNFGMAKLHLGYGKNDGDATAAAPAGIDSTDIIVGATVPVGAGKILASYIRKDDDTRFNRDANQVAVGYIHSLSKRTDLYTSFARIDNKRGAAFTVGNSSEAGSGDKAFNVGVRHAF